MDIIETRTPHKWTLSYGYDPARYCEHCKASDYETQTKFCEDWVIEKQERLEKAERRHAPTEAAWERARSLLTAEEWALMELRNRCGREYRIRDFITV